MMRNKFQPLFGPELYEVIEISNYGGVFLRSCSGNRSMHRHQGIPKLFLRKTLHLYIFNIGLPKHASSCMLIFSINMDGIETF